LYFAPLHFTFLRWYACPIPSSGWATPPLGLGLPLARYTFILLRLLYLLHLYTFVPSTSYTAPPVGSIGWLEVGGPPIGPLAVSRLRVGRGTFIDLFFLAELLKLFPTSLYLCRVLVLSTRSVLRYSSGSLLVQLLELLLEVV
jgi:hypothetical protein